MTAQQPGHPNQSPYPSGELAGFHVPRRRRTVRWCYVLCKSLQFAVSNGVESRDPRVSSNASNLPNLLIVFKSVPRLHISDVSAIPWLESICKGLETDARRQRSQHTKT